MLSDRASNVIEKNISKLTFINSKIWLELDSPCILTRSIVSYWKQIMKRWKWCWSIVLPSFYSMKRNETMLIRSYIAAKYSFSFSLWFWQTLLSRDTPYQCCYMTKPDQDDLESFFLYISHVSCHQMQYSHHIFYFKTITS